MRDLSFPRGERKIGQRKPDGTRGREVGALAADGTPDPSADALQGRGVAPAPITGPVPVALALTDPRELPSPGVNVRAVVHLARAASDAAPPAWPEKAVR
jgi:hypothetical protein